MYQYSPATRATRSPRNRKDELRDATVREFGGGWNVVDNDLNLSSRFAVLLDNMSREEDGSMGVRWGTELLADIGTDAGMADGDYIVNTYYFQDAMITVLSDGRIVRTTGAGDSLVVWNAEIAGGLVGSPAPWGPTDFASFAVFNGKLIICNGTDKPLIVDFTTDGNFLGAWQPNTAYEVNDIVWVGNGNGFQRCVVAHTSPDPDWIDTNQWEDEPSPVQYLADESNGSNVNTPVCRYVVAMNKYLVMAGDPLYPDRVHISNQNTSGTWFGDPAPNDATFVDLGKVGVQGEQVITGINRYRDQLVVGFFSASVLGKLGIYTQDDPPLHEPDFNDVIEGFGCHSHRSMVNLGNDLFMLDHQGITSIARSLYSGATEPKRVSELVDPAINANVNRLREADTILGSHGVYNSNDKQYMCFVPNHSEFARDMNTDPFEVLADSRTALWVRIPSHRLLEGDQILLQGVEAWNTVDPALMNDIDHTVTRVINDDIIQIEPDGLQTDANDVLVGGGESVTYTPRWTETLGYVYTFVNELKIRAWARYRNWRWRASARTELGTVVFADDTRLFLQGNLNNPLHSDFIGTDDVSPIAFQWEFPWADFDLRVKEKHTRYLQLDTEGTATFTLMMFVDQLYKMDGLLIPNNLMTFVGGDNGGYGNNGQPYGGGRRTADQRLYSWVARGKLMKLRFEGVTDEPLRVIAVSLLYHNGSIRR